MSMLRQTELFSVIAQLFWLELAHVESMTCVIQDIIENYHHGLFWKSTILRVVQWRCSNMQP